MVDEQTHIQVNLQPALKGSLLTLRPLLASDFESLYKAASDPLVWEQHPSYTRYQRPVFQSYFDGALESKSAFVVIDNASGEIIGSTRYYNYDPKQKEIYIGYTFLDRKYWGGKFNHQMKALLIEYASKFVDSIIFEVGENNKRSRKALENIGAKYLDDVIHQDEGVDRVHCRYKISDFARSQS
jgi:N-acetyltransferase